MRNRQVGSHFQNAVQKDWIRGALEGSDTNRHARAGTYLMRYLNVHLKFRKSCVDAGN